MIDFSLSTATGEHAEPFNRDGFVLIENLYSRDEIAQVKAHVLDLLAGTDLPNSGVVVWAPGVISEQLLAMMGDTRIMPVLHEILGPRVEFLSVKAVFKDKSKRTPSPWHQDWSYWKGTHKLSVWVALDDATEENGCLRLIPGSHTRVFEEHHVQSETGFHKRIDEKDIADLQIVDVPCAAGGAVVFHDLTLHSSFENKAGTDRWSLVSTYRDGLVRDESTVWETSIIMDDNQESE